MFTGKLKQALGEEMTPKFLATADANGKPNVVPVVSITDWDDHTLIFTELMIWKTRRNLEANKKVCVAVVTEKLDGWIIKGNFREFVTAGPMIEKLNQTTFMRYNAYLGTRRAGIIDVLEVTDSFHLGYSSILRDLLPVAAARLFAPKNNAPRKMPPQVQEKFGRLQAVKLVSFVGDDGYPRIIPALSMRPLSSAEVIFGLHSFAKEWAALSPNTEVAATVITFDPISYQIKGTFTGARKTAAGRLGAIRINEVYSANPPVPGQRLDTAND
jgi:hypothetical protein